MTLVSVLHSMWPFFNFCIFLVQIHIVEDRSCQLSPLLQTCFPYKMFWSTKPNQRWTEPSTFLTLKTLKHACVKYFLLLVPLCTVKQFSVWWLWTDIALIIIPCSCRLSTEMCWQPEMLNIVGVRNNYCAVQLLY